MGGVTNCQPDFVSVWLWGGVVSESVSQCIIRCVVMGGPTD
jgi:hypothetical protein